MTLTNLPRGWRLVALADICEVKRGQPLTRKETVAGDIPVIAGGQSPAYYHNLANRDGEVITVSGSGAYAGFVNFFERPIFASDCSTVQTKTENALMEYVYLAMKSMQPEIYALRLGSAQPHVYAKDVATITIPLPPVAEQKRIVGVLNRKMAAVTMARTAALARVEAAQSLPAAWLREVFAFENGNSLPGDWQRTTVNSAIAKVKYTKKIQKKQYLKEGIYPVVDQSQEFVAGYWNDENDLFRVKSPVVIFGDHTRIIKYVDFDFVLGADGIKILQPRNGIDARFFYYALKSISIESLGYSRHYKALQNQRIVIPPLAEQKRLVASLNAKMAATEKVRAAAEAQLEAVTALPAALLREAFSGTL